MDVPIASSDAERYFKLRSQPFLVERVIDEDDVYHLILQTHFKQRVCKCQSDHDLRALIGEIDYTSEQFMFIANKLAIVKVEEGDNHELVAVFLFRRYELKFELIYSTIFADFFVNNLPAYGDSIDTIYDSILTNVKSIMMSYGSRNRNVHDKRYQNYSSLVHSIISISTEKDKAELHMSMPKRDEITNVSCPNFYIGIGIGIGTGTGNDKDNQEDSDDLISSSNSLDLHQSIVDVKRSSTDSISPRSSSSGKPTPRPLPIGKIPKRPSAKSTSPRYMSIKHSASN